MIKLYLMITEICPSGVDHQNDQGNSLDGLLAPFPGGRRTGIVRDETGVIRVVRYMEDLISGGADRPPGGWRRRLVWIAAAAVVLTLVVAEHLPHGGSSPQASRNTGAGRHTPNLGRPAATHAQLPPAPPLGLLGPARPWAAGARLPRTGAQPDWFWPNQRRTQTIGGLPANGPGYVFTRVGGGWAIQPDPPGCGDCTGPSAPVYYLADRARTATIVGSADQIAPAATSGALWLTSYPGGQNPAGEVGIARELTGTGASIGHQVLLPAGYRIDQATDRGLLLEPITAPESTLPDRLWNPATGKVTRTFTKVVAASATQVAYTPQCGTALCPVDVVNLMTGRRLTLHLADGQFVTDATFSPDGRFLALQVSFGPGDGGDGGALAIQLEVADMTTGHLTPVPHTWVSSDSLAGFGWPGSRDDLVTELSFSTRVQMTFWDPTRASLSVAVVNPSQHPTSLILR